MIKRMQGAIQPYAWGSPTFIPALLGQDPTDEPQAELWLGAHPKAPSLVGGRPLGEVIAEDPDGVLGAAATRAFGPKLSYLFKVLAAAQPLSLQAHPSRAQAEDGYAQEEAEGIAADAGHRLFKDDWPKPELLCALTPAEALCGFRPVADTYALFEQLGVDAALSLVAPLADESLPEPDRLEQVFSAMMRLERDEVGAVLDALVARAPDVEAGSDLRTFVGTGVELAGHFPGDPGVLAALLMNRVAMAPGEAVYLPAGNLHAYLSGAGIEIMANSDNVLRGGLTKKHIDLDKLLHILDFTPGFPGLVHPELVEPGLWSYTTPATEFALWKLSPGEGGLKLPAQDFGRSLLIVEGELTLSADGEELALVRGQAAFVGAGTAASVQGSGAAFMAGPGI